MADAGQTSTRGGGRRTGKAPGITNSRYDSSLGLLTKKFCTLVEEANDGVLDLNKAAEALQVQKRRIYDITNVLEGIGLIEKKSKNNIQWRGAAGADAGEAEAQQAELRGQVAQLQEDEAALHRHISLLQAATAAMAECPDNRSRLYVTDQDIAGLPSVAGDTVFAVRAPPGTELSVPDFEAETAAQRQYKVVLNSNSTQPIEVWLVNASNNQAQSSQALRSSQLGEVPSAPAVAAGTQADGAFSMDSPGLLKIQNNDHNPDAWYEHKNPPALNMYEVFAQDMEC